MPVPLHDVRVVALEQYAAGPYGTSHLADLGAQVIKIEQPGQLDVGRSVPPFREGADSLFFQSLNRNKLSVCLDVSAPAGRRVFEELVAVSDAVFSNLRGDVPEKLGIRYADLREINPRIVCTSLSGYGMTGPRRATPGFDYMVQGIAGWMSITGEPDGPPAKTGLSAVDFSTGIVAALSTMIGIHAARRDGVGCDCDVSLLDTAMSMLTYLGTWAATRGYQPGRVARSAHPTLVPFGNFPTKDGWIVAGGSKEKFWRRFTEALGRPDLLADERFRDFSSRLTNKDALTAELDAILVAHTTDHWLAVLADHGVPCAPINTVAEAFDDPQVHARGIVESVEHPVFGRVTHLRSPARVGPSYAPIDNAPAPGEHTAQVLTELLGYDEGSLAALADAGVVAGPGLTTVVAG